MSEQNTLTLDSPELSVAEYRALRGGETVTKPVEAVEPPAAPAADAPADANAESVDPQTPETLKEKKDGINGRFSALTNEIKALKAQLAQKSAPAEAPKAETPTTPTTAANDPEPDPAKFGDYTDWQKAQIKWELRQEQRTAEAARVADQQKAAAQASAANWQARVEAAKAEMPDFETVAQNKDLAVTKVMGQAIVDTEIGAKILYHLGQNPDEATRISKLSTLAQVREIGKLEAKLTPAAAGEESQNPKPVAVSKAPAPHRPVTAAAGASSASPLKNMDSMSQSEYRALRDSGKIR
jgi:hypothetical protein